MYPSPISSVIIADLFRYSHALIFSMNYNTELYPKMDALLRELKNAQFQQPQDCPIGAMSWGGRGLAIARKFSGAARASPRWGNRSSLKAPCPTASCPNWALWPTPSPPPSDGRSAPACR